MFDDQFVRSLPFDRSGRAGTRQVTGVCGSLVTPTPVAAPTLVAWIDDVAAMLGLASPPDSAWVEALGGNRVIDGMVPYAACYGGHQFGNWAGQLGDGRAITLGEIIGPDGRRHELQLKGAGPTPYSRNADGRNFYIEITEGLKGGEEVITGPYDVVSKLLTVDKKVKVVDKKELYEKKE